MHAEHRRPLLAFATVSCACAVVIGNATGFALPTAAPGPDQSIFQVATRESDPASTEASPQVGNRVESSTPPQSWSPTIVTVNSDLGPTTISPVRAAGDGSLLQGPPLPGGTVSGEDVSESSTVPPTTAPAVTAPSPQSPVSQEPAPDVATTAPADQPPSEEPGDQPGDDVPESGDDSVLTFDDLEDLIDPEPSPDSEVVTEEVQPRANPDAANLVVGDASATTSSDGDSASNDSAGAEATATEDSTAPAEESTPPAQ